MKYESFLKWWLTFTIIAICFAFCCYIGIIKSIYQKDASFLSVVTMAIFAASSVYIGKSIFDLCKKNDPERRDVEGSARSEEVGWFMSELCLNLGMLGTIVGFVMMLAGFDGLEISNQKSIQGLLSELGKSMATALYTTLVGLVCGQLLKLQTFILSLQINRLECDANKKTV